MVAGVAADLASKHPIGPSRVEQDNRKKDQRSDEQKALGALRRSGLPQCEAMGDDHGPQTDRNADTRKKKQQDGGQKRRRVTVRT